MNWKLTTKERDDGMWEAELYETEGLFIVDVMATKKAAIKGVKGKMIDSFPIYHETPEEIEKWDKICQDNLEYARKTIG